METAISCANLSDIVDQWWPVYKLQLAGTTIKKKEDELRVHIMPALGLIKTDELTPQVLRAYIAAKLAGGSPKRHPAGLMPSTIRDHFKIIKMALQWAVENGLIPVNPARSVHMPRVQTKELQTFTPAEVALLIDKARPRWFGDLISLAYRTGMRRGELFGLKWEDIDFDNCYLVVRRSIAAKAPRERLVHLPKTESSRRRIDLDRVSMQLLARRKSIAVTEWVFEGRGGRVLSPWYIPKYMALACDNARLRRRCFHTLRHTHATLLLSKGINPKVVQERLGHSTLEMTLGTYGHVLPTMQQEVIRALDAI